MMDRRWEKRPPTLPPPHLEREHPSFSAALLDAIYRSIDSSPDHKQPSQVNAPRLDSITNALAPPAEFWRDPRATTTDHRIPLTPKHYPTTPRYRTASTSSTPRHRPNRPNRVRPDPLVPDSSPEEEKNGKKKGKRMKKKKSIKSFWKALFFFKQDKKGKLITAPDRVRASMVEPVRYFSRPCMSNKKKTEGQKRSVRFAPMSVILDEASQPCGYKSVHDHGAAVERQVEELIKSLKGEEKEKRNQSGSSSSELFKLQAVERPLSYN